MASKKTALIIGITGQDGAYLAQLLLQKNYRVIGMARRIASQDLWRLKKLNLTNIELHAADSADYSASLRLLQATKPDEIYNLGGISSVAASFAQPLAASEMIGLGMVRLLEAIIMACPNARYFQASSSEMFGHSHTSDGLDKNEESDFAPVSPYGTAKLYAHWLMVNYREAYGLHASSGILFNHESPLRAMDFVSRKITYGLARLAHDKESKESKDDELILTLGNLDNARDWGFAGDYMHAAWLMLQQPRADDYVIASGKTHSVRAMVEQAGALLGFDIIWEGSGAKMRGIDKKSGRVLVRVSESLYRPSEPDPLIGDNSRARETLGWQPRTDFNALIDMMVRAETAH